MVRIRLTARGKKLIKDRADTEDRGEVSAWLRRAIQWAQRSMPADWEPGDPCLSQQEAQAVIRARETGAPMPGDRVAGGDLRAERFTDAP